MQIAGALRAVEKIISAAAQALTRCPMIDPDPIESSCGAF
jgi:hypothetical protein